MEALCIRTKAVKDEPLLFAYSLGYYILFHMLCHIMPCHILTCEGMRLNISI
jgi:hypothetical protein